jgi:hypothetical protein
VAALTAVLVAGCSPPAVDPSAVDPTASPTVAEVQHPNGVTSVTCDLTEQARTEADAVTILGDPTWRIGGWNHVTGVGSFETVRLGISDYRISAEGWLADPTCAGAKTLDTVLLKKTYDWNQQHSNGMEAAFVTEGLTFGDVSDLVLVVRFDPERSHLPDATELTAAYGDLLTADETADLDSGAINLELTLFGEGATAEQPFMNAGLIVEIDPATASAGWVRVQVPREDLVFYTEDNYVRTEVGADQFQDLVVEGLRINPETSSGLVVRHFLEQRSVGKAFDPAAKPELFKEMALTFALIEVGRA